MLRIILDSSDYSAPRAVRATGGRRRLDLLRLRVQAPLYRQGPGYRLGSDLAGCRLLRGGVLGVILWPCSDKGAL
jgi:hypothetical protein